MGITLLDSICEYSQYKSRIKITIPKNGLNPHPTPHLSGPFGMPSPRLSSPNCFPCTPKDGCHHWGSGGYVAYQS